MPEISIFYLFSADYINIFLYTQPTYKSHYGLFMSFSIAYIWSTLNLLIRKHSWMFQNYKKR